MKLEWKETESKRMTWDEAKGLEIDRWRLPTVAELKKAFNDKIVGFELDRYWSSVTWIGNNNKLFYFDFSDGYANYDYKTSDFWVRLCREVK